MKITAKKILCMGLVATMFFSIIAISGCGGGEGDISNGKYIFQTISFGNVVIDEDDTLETIKEKLQVEFPHLEWNVISHFSNITNLEIDANIIYNKIFGSRRLNYIQITGDRLNISVNGDVSGSIGGVNNRRYRLSENNNLEFRIRGNYNDNFRNQWRSTGLEYEDNVIFHTERIFRHIGTTVDFNPRYRLNYRIIN
ncbi:MAG: hypothetical protein FWE03_04205 [Firmicutes bacterium]|nr:hypothetical protein [Bacillota bacterium]